MTIRLTEAEVEEQFQEADEEELQFDPTDKLDTTFKFDGRFVQGWERRIALRDGIQLTIEQTSQSTDRMIISGPAVKAAEIDCYFLLSGNYQASIASASSENMWPFSKGEYWLSGTGSRGGIVEDYDVKPWSQVNFTIPETTFRSFTASSDGEIPEHLQHLVQPAHLGISRRIGSIQPMMTTVLRQILQCPYEGIVKRAYLESKAIELMALVLDHEVAIQRGETKKSPLKPDQLERIHYAKEILLRDLNNPPSLEGLARQVGLNDFLLKKGFRQVFGTTVFGELQAQRLELAKQLLAEKSMSTAEISYLVGYASQNSFARAFKHKFGFTPTAYRKACRQRFRATVNT